MGNTRHFLSNSGEIPVFPAGMGNTHKSGDFANPVQQSELLLKEVIAIITCLSDFSDKKLFWSC